MVSTTPVPAGRPRAFDIDEALDRAVLVFWSKGFEGASLDDLTEAMGISRPSLYRAFGNKEDLFYKALERYTEGLASYFARALAEPTSGAVATAVLHGTVEAATMPGFPTGCLGVQGALDAPVSTGGGRRRPSTFHRSSSSCALPQNSRQWDCRPGREWWFPP